MLVLLTNPLFGVVAFLVGIILGVLVGRWSRDKEWAKREALMRERIQDSPGGCWVKGQIDAGNTPQF